jgi:hypothetical protein
MQKFLWLKESTRIVFKTGAFDMWRTGKVKEIKDNGVYVASDRINSKIVPDTFIEYKYIVGEATEEFTPYPFYWGNVLEHLTEEAKENL